MRFRIAFSLATFFLMCFTVALWTPTGAGARNLSGGAESESVTGRIVVVSDTQLTLALAPNQTPDKLQFTINENTKVQGHMTAGSEASVEYHKDGEQLVATRIVVSNNKPSGE